MAFKKHYDPKRDESNFVEASIEARAKKREFMEDFWKALELLAQQSKTKKKPDDVLIDFVAKGILEGIKGNFPFWREIVERVYGKVKEEIAIEEKPIIVLKED